MKKKELEQRLIAFAVAIVRMVESMPHTRAGNHLAGQLLRSGTSPALNYGEAQSGESRSDFLHKIVLKELRETFNCLRIIARTTLFGEQEKMNCLLKENDELIALFVKSCETARRNLMNKV